MDPRLDPFASITCQAKIPNNSEVFKIVKHGKLEDLLKAFENKTARLTDRDEEGRSLLNVSHIKILDWILLLESAVSGTHSKTMFCILARC